MNGTKRVAVIGISGTTNSGKSTLTRKLSEELENSTWVCQDSYFLPPGDPRLAPLYLPEINHHNWEDYQALEMDKMVEDVKKMVSEAKQPQNDSHVFLIEGFSIFGYRALEELLDKKYFIKVDKDVCWKRRQTRDYNPPDVPGYFEKVVWPSYQTHLKEIQNQNDIVYFSGSNSVDNLYQQICEDLKQMTS